MSQVLCINREYFYKCSLLRIFYTPVATATGKEAMNIFPPQEIIYDPSMILRLRVAMLGLILANDSFSDLESHVW
jgi:hypothetical protein